MDILQLLIIVTLLVILGEVTYLAARLPRQNVFKKQTKQTLVDTSALIDGRILAVAKSGFMTDTIVIPRSVIAELQYLADNADHEKRARARHGLDVVAELQQVPHATVEILQDGMAKEGVDNRLLKLAKKSGASICTIDYNLNKVAIVEGIRVLNVNELAQSLRMAYLPGERMLLDLVQKGQDTHQGVGHLPDGTMVVVEHANKLIGQTVEIEFIRSLQTAAGRMMFARLVGSTSSVSQKPQASPKKTPKQHSVRAKAPVKRPNEAPGLATEESSTQPIQTKPATDTRPNLQRTRKRKRPRSTSESREAALIDLVDKQ